MEAAPIEDHPLTFSAGDIVRIELNEDFLSRDKVNDREFQRRPRFAILDESGDQVSLIKEAIFLVRGVLESQGTVETRHNPMVLGEFNLMLLNKEALAADSGWQFVGDLLEWQAERRYGGRADAPVSAVTGDTPINDPVYGYEQIETPIIFMGNFGRRELLHRSQTRQISITETGSDQFVAKMVKAEWHGPIPDPLLSNEANKRMELLEEIRQFIGSKRDMYEAGHHMHLFSQNLLDAMNTQKISHIQRGGRRRRRKSRKTNRRKTNRRKTNRRKTNRRKT